MLSDSIFETIEFLLEACSNYDYVDYGQYADDIIENITNMRMLLSRMDCGENCHVTREKMKQFVIDDWRERFEAKKNCWLSRI